MVDRHVTSELMEALDVINFCACRSLCFLCSHLQFPLAGTFVKWREY